MRKSGLINYFTTLKRRKSHLKSAKITRANALLVKSGLLNGQIMLCYSIFALDFLLIVNTISIKRYFRIGICTYDMCVLGMVTEEQYVLNGMQLCFNNYFFHICR